MISAPVLPRVAYESESRAPEPPESYWRSLYYFNSYRFVVALLLLGVSVLFGDRMIFGSMDFRLFVYASSAYVVFSAAGFMLIATRRYFHAQLGLQVAADIAFISLMMFASGGIASGLGLLLLSALAGAGLISRGRLTLFYAALASLAVLIEHTVEVLYFFGTTAQYVQAGLLSIGYFATAWVAHTLARYLVATERLVAQREIDFANMSEISRLVIQEMQDGVVVVDDQGVIRQNNARAEDLFGVLKQRQRDPLLGEISPALARRFGQWRDHAPPHGEADNVVAFDDRLNARFAPVGGDHRAGAVIFIEDATRLRAQARQMKLAALGRLTANIAHEIRNPLSAISHATELLQEEPAANETSSRLLTIIRDNTRRLERVVNDVLKLNRGERARRESFNLAEYLRTFVEEFCQIERVSPEWFEVELAADPEVSFDLSHLNQVMWNLCRNALRHCRRRRASIRIVVDPLEQRNTIQLNVIDDGLGVPVELRNRLFEPFFTTAASGTGLGLYIAREMCEANDATLEYVETPEGAQFTVTCRSA